jgi:3-deoxy-D-manno-octulosonic-acid transferase
VHPDEVAVIGEAHAALAGAHPGLLTIIVPRHPERGAAFAARLGGVAVTRRAAGEGPPEGAGVWIADTLGELGLFYRLAPVVVMGRSLAAPGGGQNPLEAARLGCAVAAGPLMENFEEVAATLEAAGALARVEDAAGLAAWVDGMLREPDRRATMGAAGLAACDRLDTLPDEMAAELLALVAHEGHA